MAAVFRIDLRKAEYLAVGQLPAESTAQLFQIGDFVFAEGKAFLFVVGCHVIDIDNRVWLLADRINILIDRMVLSTQHRIEGSIFVVGFDKLFDSFDSFQAHVLGDLHGIRAPRGDHFATWADKYARDTFRVDAVCTSLQPLQTGKLLFRKLYGRLYGKDRVVFFEKQNHINQDLCVAILYC